MSIDPIAFLRGLFGQAVQAADPLFAVPPHLPPPPKGRTVVVGLGKAAAVMAQAVERHWPGPIEGVVVTRDDHEAPTDRITVLSASHPVPDERSEAGARRLLDAVAGLTADDLVLCLVSGGGSALCALPAPGLTLADKIAVNKALLRSGASIDEMNCVRKHLSGFKGGRLARAAAPAKLVALLISDVPGDDPAVIASGPTVPDPTSFADALALVRRYRLDLPDAVRRHLEEGADETPKPGDPAFAHVENRLIAAPQRSLERAAAFARAKGIRPVLLGDALEGEARQVATVMAGIARSVRRHGEPVAAPCVLLSGGETTVTVHGNGRGGRNVEFLLGLAVALQGEAGVYGIAGDTDGIDGAEDVAGAVVTPDTLGRAAALGLDARAMLDDNDAHSFFEKLGDQVVTGPTLTNVNDIRAVLVM
ncbi:MAG TPA: glycerate kinase [Geminicoccus sp.]|jgi:glycerate-2-kinase|uniref:glycerate kinase type-2 family protein n=1 Tax=Geminicoccus sp. TaxID=2024832 RepID=UPI002E32325D|nr:glycerate kinase [Geminicoccus sp.]HEX2527563.1 glycerate kinase [Geminicoccus sp.]